MLLSGAHLKICTVIYKMSQGQILTKHERVQYTEMWVISFPFFPLPLELPSLLRSLPQGPGI